MAMRAEEIGKSECQPVTGWIGVQTLPWPETVPTSDWSLIV